MLNDDNLSLFNTTHHFATPLQTISAPLRPFQQFFWHYQHPVETFHTSLESLNTIQAICTSLGCFQCPDNTFNTTLVRTAPLKHLQRPCICFQHPLLALSGALSAPHGQVEHNPSTSKLKHFQIHPSTFYTMGGLHDNLANSCKTIARLLQTLLAPLQTFFLFQGP